MDSLQAQERDRPVLEVTPQMIEAGREGVDRWVERHMEFCDMPFQEELVRLIIENLLCKQLVLVSR